MIFSTHTLEKRVVVRSCTTLLGQQQWALEPTQVLLLLSSLSVYQTAAVRKQPHCYPFCLESGVNKSGKTLPRSLNS
jgi:hypothetical protein